MEGVLGGGGVMSTRTIAINKSLGHHTAHSRNQFLGWAERGVGGGGRSFQYIGPVIWNSLPLSVRHLSSLS